MKLSLLVCLHINSAEKKKKWSKRSRLLKVLLIFQQPFAPPSRLHYMARAGTLNGAWWKWPRTDSAGRTDSCKRQVTKPYCPTRAWSSGRDCVCVTSVGEFSGRHKAVRVCVYVRRSVLEDESGGGERLKVQVFPHVLPGGCRVARSSSATLCFIFLATAEGKGRGREMVITLEWQGTAERWTNICTARETWPPAKMGSKHSQHYLRQQIPIHLKW